MNVAVSPAREQRGTVSRPTDTRDRAFSGPCAVAAERSRKLRTGFERPDPGSAVAARRREPLSVGMDREFPNVVRAVRFDRRANCLVPREIPDIDASGAGPGDN